MPPHMQRTMSQPPRCEARGRHTIRKGTTHRQRQVAGPPAGPRAQQGPRPNHVTVHRWGRPV
eukprot:9995542-Alexandrium_andersonii.AAC.1